MSRASRVDVLLVAVGAFCAVALIAAASLSGGGTSGGGGALTAQLADAAERPPLSWEEANQVLEPHSLAAPPAGAPMAVDHAHPATPADRRNQALTRAAGSSDRAHSHGDDGHSQASSHSHGDDGHGHGSPGHMHGDDSHGHGHGHDDDSPGHMHGDHAHDDHGSPWEGHHPQPEPDGDGRVAAPSYHAEDKPRTKLFGDPTGEVSGWEINYEGPQYAEEDCGTDVGGVGFYELDPNADCTLTNSWGLREGDPEEYFSGHDHGDDDCSVTPEQYAGAFAMAEVSRSTVVATYENNPWQAIADGYKPYPVAATKTFHMFSWDHWDARHADGSPDLYNAERPAMFTYGMTEQGLTVVNIVYTFSGSEAELPDGMQEQWFDMLPRPFGCMVEWHAHADGVEGPATGNLDGREFMTHIWTWPRTGATWEYGDGQVYEGPYPFGEYLDGTEGHAWFMPFWYLPALCNKDGGCI